MSKKCFILSGSKTKVPLDYINGLSVGDVEEFCGGDLHCYRHTDFIFTTNVVNFLQLINLVKQK